MVWVDNSRIIAIFSVILIHVASSYLIDVETINSNQWWIGNFFDASVRWSVPVFVMLSGLLLLSDGKNEPISSFYKKRAVKILVPLLFWTIFFLIMNCINRSAAGNTPSITDVLKILLSGKPYFHMWFIYMIMGLYFATPFIRVVVKNVSRKELIFLVIVLFFLALINSLFESIYGIKKLLFVNWFLPYLSYFIFGHIIYSSKLKIKNIVLLLVFALTVVFTAFGYYWGVKFWGIGKGGYAYDFFSFTVAPMSISVMFLFLNLKKPLFFTKKANRILADMVLGIYLIHPLILELLVKQGIYIQKYDALIAIPAITLLTFTASAIIVWFIRLIPFVQRIV